MASIPVRSKPYPNTADLSPEEFDDAMNRWFAETPAIEEAVAEAVGEVAAYALNAEAAAGAAVNAKWVSGTYAQGAIVWSPTDFLDYRCKVAGNRTIDPALDPTNWVPRIKTSNGGADTTSSATNVTLTASSGRLQVVAMTAADKKVTLPAATSLQSGIPLFVIKNSGQYRFAVMKNGGAFLCYVYPGQAISFGCSDVSTAAGVWTVSGDSVGRIYDGNTAEVLNAVDSRFISVAMLTSTKAICAYKNNSTGFLWAVILNFGSASGTPVAVTTAEAVKNISIAAQTSTQATVVYQVNGTTTLKGYVLDISGNSITPGTVATIHTNGTNGNEGTHLIALSPTKLLCVYINASSSNILERVLDISGSTITASTQISVDASAIGSGHSIFAKGATVSATKALVAFVGTSLQILLRLQSITVSTPAPTGSVLSIPAVGNPPTTGFALCVISLNRAVLIRSFDRAYGDIAVYLLDISGTTPALLASKNLTAPMIVTGTNISATKLDSNKVYITWTGGFSLGADGMVITITNDDRILEGQIAEGMEPGLTSAFGYLACDALDSTHVIQVCRNASTFLSAKTIEIG